MPDLQWTSAAEQHRLLRAGELIASELHDEVVGVIAKLDPIVNAVVIPLFDRPSEGVPILLKDAGQEIAGTSHWIGVAAMRDAEVMSHQTTPLAQKLESVGFSIVGKGSCPALSDGITTEPAGFEPTRNPWDRSRSAGGSSGGPAAAVASGMVAVAHGSDATGSLRCPAALCGVATLNPSTGRIPVVPPAGQLPNAAWREFVLARHAHDLSFVFERLTGSAVPDSAESLRIGILDHDPELGLPVHGACAEGVHVAARLLEALGHRVEVAWPEALDHLWSTAFDPLSVVADAIRPPVLRWVTERLGRPVQRGEVHDRVFDAAERAQSRSEREVQSAKNTLEATMRPILGWWNHYDILVTPTTFQPAWPLGSDAGFVELGTLLAPFSLTGQPALSLPLHVTDEGLPVGVQLVGRMDSDEMLLRLAEELQAAHDWTSRRPPLP